MDKLRLSELFEEKAKRFLEGAKSAMNYGDYSGAVHKAYYSIFHLSKAYLMELERVEEAIKLAEEYHKILFELIASLRKNLSEGL